LEMFSIEKIHTNIQVNLDVVDNHYLLKLSQKGFIYRRNIYIL
jgi:hypothetical protein